MRAVKELTTRAGFKWRLAGILGDRDTPCAGFVYVVAVRSLLQLCMEFNTFADIGLLVRFENPLSIESTSMIISKSVSHIQTNLTGLPKKPSIKSPRCRGNVQLKGRCNFPSSWQL